MDRLPAEVVLNTYGRSCPRDTHEFLSNYALKPARLCSRNFAGPAAEFLFTEVLAFMTPDSLRNLSAIVDHKVYRDRFRSIVVFGSMIFII